MASFGNDLSDSEKPAVWRWYVAYCVAWALFYGLTAGFILFLAFGPGVPRAEPFEGNAIALALFLGLCVAPERKRRPTYGGPGGAGGDPGGRGGKHGT